ncbi:MAG: hypothetical protein AAGC44_03560 [Planctomycetota bacterium]
MIKPDQPTAVQNLPRKPPSRMWYALSAVILLMSFGVFFGAILSKAEAVRDRIETMPRFVAPIEGGHVVDLAEPGHYIIYHENLGTLEGQAFDNPRRQVWPTMASPAMTCRITREGDGRSIEARLPGVDNPTQGKREVTTDLIPAYNTAGRQGHGVWVFDIDQPGRYRVELAYVPEINLDPDAIALPEALTREVQGTMTSAQGKAYEVARREAQERLALAGLEPVDVLIAVGQDPTDGSYFNLLGVRGAATVLAFGFTASAIIGLVTLMLRGGHVTPRGELNQVQRGLLTKKTDPS